MRSSYTYSRLLAPVNASLLARLAPAVWLSATLGLYPAPLLAQTARAIGPQVEATLVARPEMPAAGPKDADVTIIEFLDYNCPFCRKTAPELEKLLRADPKVRIIIKEWPIFGEVSQYAARSVLAAKWQGRSLAAHDALIGAPHDLDEVSQVESELKAAGIDLARLTKDRKLHAAEIDAAVARYANEARSLGLRGTPGFVIGRQLVPRALTLPALQELVAGARSTH
jgi:protein-disulfide isomerase